MQRGDSLSLTTTYSTAHEAHLMDQALNYQQQGDQWLARGDKKQAVAMYNAAAKLAITIAESTPSARDSAMHLAEYCLDRANKLTPKGAPTLGIVQPPRTRVPAASSSSTAISLEDLLPSVPGSQPTAPSAPVAMFKSTPPAISPSPSSQPDGRKLMARAAAAFKEGQDEQRALHYNEARRKYMAAAELFLSVTGDAALVSQSRIQAEAAMTAAESMQKFLYGADSVQASKPTNTAASPLPTRAPAPNTGPTDPETETDPSDLLNMLPSPASSAPRATTKASGDKLSKEELAVIAYTSTINGIEYLPYIAEFDQHEQFKTKTPFVDPNGTLALSPKQAALLGSWVRPSQISDRPRMIVDMTSKCIQQVGVLRILSFLTLFLV